MPCREGRGQRPSWTDPRTPGNRGFGPLCKLCAQSRLMKRKQVSKVKGGPVPMSPTQAVKYEDFNEQIPNPRRPDGAGWLRQGAAGRARVGRAAPQLSRCAGRLAGGAARVRAL